MARKHVQQPSENEQPRYTTTADWHESIFDARLGGAEYFKPGVPGRENPRRMARAYYLLTIRDIAPEVLSNLTGMRRLAAEVCEAEQHAWDAVPPHLKGSAKDMPAPIRATYVSWVCDYYTMARDGHWAAIEHHEEEFARANVAGGRALRNLVNQLLIWGKRYRLDAWMVESFVTAFDHWRRSPTGDMDIECYVTSPSGGSQYPLEPERVEYRFNAGARGLRVSPPVNKAVRLRRVVDEGDPPTVNYREDRRSGYLRELVVRFEGYDPTTMTGRRFKAYAKRMFEQVVEDYVSVLDHDLEQLEFQKCPEMHSTAMFEMAVQRFVLGWTPEQIAEANGCKIPNVEKSIKRVKDWMQYEPENLPRKPRNAKPGRRIRNRISGS